MFKESRIINKQLSVLLAILLVLISVTFSALTAFAFEGTDTDIPKSVEIAEDTEEKNDSENEENPEEDLLETPILLSVSNTATGIKISWKAVDGAEMYRVFYKTDSGDWTEIADTTSTGYTWTGAKSGTAYTFTVCCISSDGLSYTSDYDHTGISIDYVAAPKLSSVKADNSGVVINWAKSAGAVNYRVYYKTSGGSWTKIADTTSDSYTWTGAKSGTTYTFTVRCISSDGKSYTSSYDNTGLSFTAVAKPKLSTVENTATGVKISWDKVSKAEKYRVYYKTSGGSWNKIADTASTSYTWTGPKSGTTYTFTVRCISSDGKVHTSGYDTAGKSIKYIAAPKLSSVTIASKGIQVDWEKTTGAEKYRIYYKTASTSWTKIGETTGASYVWSGAKAGINYTFTVRCITGDGKNFASDFDHTGLDIEFAATPTLTSANAVSNGIQITWEKSAGAQNYRVYCKTGSGSWTKIADTTATSYTWTAAKIGTKYAFTVRCVNSDGTKHTSWYDSTGLSVTYASTPKLSSVTAASKGIQIDWEKATGAEKYRIYYKTASTSWTKIGETTGASYVWSGAKAGTNYTFTVRCITSDGKNFASDFDHTGLDIEFAATPKLTSANAVSNGIQITWEKSAGAQNYRVYCKTGSGSWTKIADTTATSYTWTAAKIGTKYAFTVRCVNSDGTKHTSWYDSAGLEITYVSIPKISAVTSVNSGVKINWGKATGAEKYRVYYKNSSGGWTGIVETTGESYTWTGAMSGKKYTFTVRCVSSDGKSFTSYYDTVGVTATFSGTTLNSKANAASEKYSNCTRFVYGTSAMGYQLEAYIISGNGNNSRILFMDFAVHGYEDEYAKDGKVLVTLGNGLVEYYSAHPELLGNYRLVIVPCANPDGAMFGKNNYRADKAGAFGRCTYKGIDINRDFMSGGFKAVESVALRNLMNKYKPNVYLNFHGWEDSVIGNPQLVNIFRSKVGLKTDKSDKYGSDQGYIIGYVKDNYGAKAALVEFKNSKSVNQTKVINAINSVISNRL